MSQAVMVHAFPFSTQEAEAGISEFEASLGYRASSSIAGQSCLGKQTNKETKTNSQVWWHIVIPVLGKAESEESQPA